MYSLVKIAVNSNVSKVLAENEDLKPLMIGFKSNKINSLEILCICFDGIPLVWQAGKSIRRNELQKALSKQTQELHQNVYPDAPDYTKTLKMPKR